MNFYLHCLLVFILIYTILIYSIASNPHKLDSNNELALKVVSQGANEFSSHLFKVLSHGHHGNMVCSPLSVRLVLSMALHGSIGNTLVELESVLKTPPSESVLKHGVKALLGSLNDVDGVELTLANKIFVKKNAKIISEFSDVISEYYNSAVDTTDFDDPEKAVKSINDWIEDQTKHQIKQVLNPSDLIGDVLMVLVNAVYFHGSWANKFKQELTHDANFYVSNNRTINVKMMKTTAYFNWGKIPHVKVRYIELPYKSDAPSRAISMFIIIPDEEVKLGTVRNRFHKINFTELMKECVETELYLPKFKIESKHDLIPPLKKMGINKAFDNSAEFPNILKNENLKISNILQKAFIEVNEAGTKAAAASVAISPRVAGKFFPDDIPVFKVDSPFLCVIIDKNTQTQLFIAQVINPLKH